MLVAPSFSYAQTVPVTTSDLDSLKTQLIALLTQEVQILQDQLTALIAQQKVTAEDVATIKANTTPVATGGAVDNTIVPFVVYQLAYEIRNDGSKGLYYWGSETLSSITIDERKNDVFNDASSTSLTLGSYQTNTHDASCGHQNCGGYIYRINLPQDIQTPGPYKITFTSTSGESATLLISLGYSGSQGQEFNN